MSAVPAKAGTPAPAPKAAKGKWITCEMIAFEQMKVLFALFKKAGLNYNDPADKAVILSHTGMACGKSLSLSKLSLGERLELIRHLARAWKLRAVTVGVPNRLRTWRKGDPPKGYARKDIPEGTPLAQQKRYILGLWLELGYEPALIDERCKRQWNVERLEWLNDSHALQTLTKDLYGRCAKAGLAPEPHE